MIKSLYTLVASLFLLLPGSAVFSQELQEFCKYYDLKKGADIPKVRVLGKKYIIRVQSDSDFEHVNNSIISALKSGEKNIIVSLKRGTYHFHQNHLDLRGLYYPDASIVIEGNGATILPECKKYIGSIVDGGVRRSDYLGDFTPESLFITDQGGFLDVWTTIRQTTGTVQVMSTNVASIPSVFRFGVVQDSRIRIPHWYYSTQYPISSLSKEGIITFRANSSKGFDKDYRGKAVLDYDYAVSKEPVRYQCFNIENIEVPYCRGSKLYFPERYKSVLECATGQFVLIASTKLKQFRMNGLNCFGSRGGGHYINLSSVDAEIIAFTKCSFKGLKNTVLMINKTDNVCFSYNTVKNCFAHGVYSMNGSRNTVVNNCLFSDNGQSMIQHSCIYCVGENYHIYDNEIRDFTYAAIFVGVHSSVVKSWVSSGIIEKNEVYYTREYFDNYWKYTLADGGAIYLSSQNEEVIIRNNYIHDYKGINGNRAIFGDSGAKNVIIYGNIIKRVPNYYAIDLYRVTSVDKNVPDANSGNMVFGNFIDGAYNIGGRSETSCKDGGNVLVSNTYNRFNVSRASNSQSTGKNIEAENTVSSAEKRVAKRSIPTYKRLKRYF